MQESMEERPDKDTLNKMIAIKKELISQELGGGRLLANTACRDTREFGPLPLVDDP